MHKSTSYLLFNLTVRIHFLRHVLNAIATVLSTGHLQHRGLINTSGLQNWRDILSLDQNDGLVYNTEAYNTTNGRCFCTYTAMPTWSITIPYRGKTVKLFSFDYLLRRISVQQNIAIEIPVRPWQLTPLICILFCFRVYFREYFNFIINWRPDRYYIPWWNKCYTFCSFPERAAAHSYNVILSWTYWPI